MKEPFGKTEEGLASIYSIENDKFVMKVTDYGATLVSLIDKKTGIDTVIGFDSIQGYIRYDDAYICASVGRVANRIKDGVFTMNGKEYHVPINNGTNSLHGGLKGFSKHLWKAEEKENAVIFNYHSPDGEEGYPGNMDVTITFTLDEKGVEIQASATSDADTLFAYTCHAYFNMDGSDSVLNQKLKVHGTQYSPLDGTGVATPNYVDMAGTPFDFREFKEIGKDIDNDNEQLKQGNGYDHYFDILGVGLRPMAELEGEKLKAIVSSDMPGIHIYSANYTETEEGKNGKPYHARCACALESEYLPNAWNYGGNLKMPLLKKGETNTVTIRYDIVENS